MHVAVNGPQLCSMLGAPQVPEVLLNGARIEVQAMHTMDERFGAVSVKAVLSGVRWMAELLGVGLLVFLEGVETYRKGIT